MKILFVISSIGIGGEQRVAKILTDYFIEKDIEVDLLTFKKEEKSFEFNEEININVLKKSKKLKNIIRVIEVRKAMMKNNYDMIIGFAIIPGIITSLANIGLKQNVVISERNDPAIYPKIWKKIRKFSYKFAKVAVFQTNNAMDYFHDYKIQHKTVIHNPLDTKKLPDRKIEDRRNVIVNTARLTPAKNQSMLIKAFKNIETDFPEYNLEIYGDGPLKDELLKLVRSLGLEQRVFLKAARANVLDEIKDSSIFVLSSNNEGFPNSLAEAMAMGIPCISTDCRIGGPREMITNNKNGLLVQVDDVKELEKALRKMLENDIFRESISLKAYKIREELKVDIIGEQWLDFINK